MYRLALAQNALLPGNDMMSALKHSAATGGK
jgi:hypothetical protein